MSNSPLVAGPLKLPFGKQFSPEQISLKVLLGLIVQHAGSRTALESAIAQSFHAHKADPSTLAMNTFLAARAYGLLTGDETYSPTDLAIEFQSLDEVTAHGPLAAHILTELQGLTVIEVVRARVARAGPLRIQDIADDFRQLGVDPGGQRGENLSALRVSERYRNVLIELGCRSYKVRLGTSSCRALLGGQPSVVLERAEYPLGEIAKRLQTGTGLRVGGRGDRLRIERRRSGH